MFVVPGSVAGQDQPAATGSITGTVTEQGAGIVVPDAKIVVAGTELETTSDEDGSFRFDGVPAGQRTLEVELEGYISLPYSVQVKAGEEATVPIELFSEGGVRTVLTEGRLKAGSKRALDLERKRGSEVMENIGAEEMSERNVGDAGEAAASLPAVNIVNGKFAYIRGLGGRYSQTLVNGSTIPSPEPDLRVIPLDLFNASVIQSLSVTKSYAPYLPGEFAGGSVRIETIDIPEEGFFQVGVSVKARKDTTFRDFKTYNGGNLDTLAYGAGARELPREVPSDFVVPSPGGLTDLQVQQIGRSFDNIWNVDTVTAPLDHNLNFSFGDSYDTGSTGKFGIVGAAGWKNEYQRIKDEKFRVLLNGGTIEDPDPFVFNDFDFDTSYFQAELNGTVNVAYEPMPAQKVGFRNFFVRSATDRVRLQEGIDGQQDREIQVTNLRYVERGLYNGQLFGEHLLAGDTFLDWRASFSYTERDEPDNRSLRYDFIEAADDFLLNNVAQSGSRDYYYLDEQVIDLGADYAIPFDLFGYGDPETRLNTRPDQRLQFGASYATRDRNFDARRFRFVQSTVSGVPEDENGNPIDLSLGAEEIFDTPNINPNGFILTENTRDTDNYEADQLLVAGYAMADFNVARDWRLQTGVRVERSDQDVKTFELFAVPPTQVRTELDETDYLPSVNLTWRLPWEWSDNMQIRMGASQTVSRPEFRELAPFEFTDISGGFAARGNPDLDRALILNTDIRWEWFPAPGELISASLFYKDFDDPIERVIIPTGSALLSTWENADSAELYGFEVEFRKRLAKLAEWTDVDFIDDLSLSVNFAFIDSDVDIASSTFAVQTNDSRKLQGQPEYTANVALLYDNKDYGVTAGILMSTIGETITAVGAFGVPDEELQPRINLDFTIAKQLGQASIRFTAENILDEKFERKQGSFVTSEFKKGWTVGVSYSYRW